MSMILNYAVKWLGLHHAQRIVYCWQQNYAVK